MEENLAGRLLQGNGEGCEGRMSAVDSKDRVKDV
jgi:hypothetical protein